jgi:hypothetical protein
MNATFTITLTKKDWDENLGAWRCPPLGIPGAIVDAVFSQGVKLDDSWYVPLPNIAALRWTHGTAPKQAAVSISLTKPLTTEELTQRWKKLAIILPAIMLLVAPLMTVLVTRLIMPKETAVSQNQIAQDEKANVIQLFYDRLNGRNYEDAWALIHRARKEEIRGRIKDANDFKSLYASTVTHKNIKIVSETHSDTEATYNVSFDVQDAVLRNELYQSREEKISKAFEKGIINKDKLVDLVFENLNDYFILPDKEKERIGSMIGQSQLSSLFSPMFIQEFGRELNLNQRSGFTQALRDPVWRHILLRITLRRDDGDWKILSGLDRPVIAIYGPGAAIQSK